MRQPEPARSSASGSPLALVAAWGILLAVAVALLSGFFVSTTTLGAHDWDQMEANRYFVVKSIQSFGQFPFWDPYACGGFHSWGAAESGTTIVSLFLPVYLVLPLATAVRVEVVTLVLLLLAGLWFFAGRYVKSPLLLAFVCLVAGENSRTALQAAVGHTWHLYYAGMPWVLGAFDRALDDGECGVRVGWMALGAVVLALMIYGGGVYPVPHTALCLLILGAYRSGAARSWRSLGTAIAILGEGALLAAPKLLCVLEGMSRFPRRVTSLEMVPPLHWLDFFITSEATFPNFYARGLPYLWHEYGQYVGLLPLAVLAWGVLARVPRDPRLQSIRLAGYAMMLLAMGYPGPWALLHLVPPFSSMHVPTRFTYPAFFLFAVVAADSLGHALERWRARWGERRVGVAAWTLLALSAALIAREDRRCTLPWFSLDVPAVAERTEPFVQYKTLPSEYVYAPVDEFSPGGIHGAPALLMDRANLGSIGCSEFAGLNQDVPPGPDGRPPLLGARGSDDPLYKGEYWLASGGAVDLVRWTPGEVLLRARGAKEGDLLMLNQNWASGWSANGVPALNQDEVNAYRVRSPGEVVTFRFRPRNLPAGLVACALGLALFVGAFLGERRARRSPSP